MTFTIIKELIQKKGGRSGHVSGLSLSFENNRYLGCFFKLILLILFSVGTAVLYIIFVLSFLCAGIQFTMLVGVYKVRFYIKEERSTVRTRAEV